LEEIEEKKYFEIAILKNRYKEFICYIYIKFERQGK